MVKEIGQFFFWYNIECTKSLRTNNTGCTHQSITISHSWLLILNTSRQISNKITVMALFKHYDKEMSTLYRLQQHVHIGDNSRFFFQIHTLNSFSDKTLLKFKKKHQDSFFYQHCRFPLLFLT